MKKYIGIFFFLISFFAFTQKNKLDRIIKKDYSIIEVKVTKISEKNIEYSFPTETLVNTLDLSKVVRIEYANGRIQSFNNISEANNQEEQSNSNNSTSYQVQTIKENFIAVLPIPFINSETLSNSEEMAKFAQNDIYSKLIQKSSNISPLSIQDIRTTNGLLRKAGIDYRNIDEIPVEDLQKILGVDNILAAKVSYSLKPNQTTESQSSSQTEETRNGIRTDDFSYSNTEIDNDYLYNVYFDFYKNNAKIYTKNRRPFLDTKNSWMDSMTYLLKRSPIYIRK